MLASGISILRGIELLEKHLDKKTASICRLLLINLKSGKTLSEAMRHNTDFFPNLVITLTNIGEQSGQLQLVLISLIDYYTKQKELKGFMIKALMYPLFLIFIAFCVFFFFLVYVLPILASAYNAFQAKPSLFLQLALDFSSFIKSWFLPIAILIFLLSMVIYNSLPKIFKLLMKLKWFNEIYSLLLEARFCKLLAILLKSGIKIDEAIIIAGKAIDDNSKLSKLQLFTGYLQKGIDISTALEHSLGLFTALTEELLTIGASTGSLPEMLEEAATIAEDDLHEKLDRIREFLAPVFLLLAAVLIAGIISTVMTPLFDLFNAIPE